MWVCLPNFAFSFIFQIPFLPGDTDLDQLSKIFQVLGTPTKATWPVSLIVLFILHCVKDIKESRILNPVVRV